MQHGPARYERTFQSLDPQRSAKVAELRTGRWSVVFKRVSPSGYTYDAWNRVTNLVDAVGMTKYTYAQGLSTSEDGPWSGDTVTYTCITTSTSAPSSVAPTADGPRADEPSAL